MHTYDDDVPITRELFRSVLPTGFAIIAFFLAFIGCVQCNAIKFTSTSGFDENVTIQFGFWSHEDVSFTANAEEGYSYIVLSCTGYSGEVEVDAKWKAAAAFSIIPLILGGISFVWICVKRCNSLNHRCDWLVYILAFVCQSLSLLFLDSSACKNNSVMEEIASGDNMPEDVAFQETCSLAQGMKCIIAAVVFWFLAAIGSLDAYRAKKKSEDVALVEPLIEEGSAL